MKLNDLHPIYISHLHISGRRQRLWSGVKAAYAKHRALGSSCLFASVARATPVTAVRHFLRIWMMLWAYLDPRVRKESQVNVVWEKSGREWVSRVCVIAFTALYDMLGLMWGLEKNSTRPRLDVSIISKLLCHIIYENVI